MAIFAVNSYFSGKVSLNCQGGGYTEVYNLLTTDAAEAQQQMGAICKLREAVMEGGTRIANCVVSVVQPAGTNPADGITIPHSNFLGPSLMNAQLPLLAAETVPGGTAYPAVGLFWKLDTGIGSQEGRLLRSIRNSWIVNNRLVVSGVLPLGATLPATATVLATSYAAVDPGVALSNYFSYVRNVTCFIKKTPTLTTKFTKTTFAAQFVTPGNGPDWKYIRISSKNVGLAWPQVAGRQASWA
jgi:hypothetical protein